MKERLLTLALAGGALALFYALFIPKPTPKGEEVSAPLSAERGPNGYLALRQWLVSEHVEVVSLRDRFDKLGQASKQAEGNLLITTMPHRLGVRKAEIERLHEWVASGNSVLIMAGLADTPEWAMDGHHNGNLIRELGDLIGVEFYTNEPPARKRAARGGNEKSSDDKSDENKDTSERIVDTFKKLIKPAQREFIPSGSHPLFEDVRSVEALSEYPASDWKARPKEGVAAVLELAHLSSPDTPGPVPAFWLANYDRGQIIISAFASPFVNKLIGARDNAQLLSNIVGWSLTPGGAVIFDDAHQGAVAFYDPQAFFNDARLHRALLWILFLWLVFVLGPSRLRPIRSNWKPVEIISFVRASGGFMARTLSPVEAERRATAIFFNGVRRRIGLPENGAPVWDWLESQGRVVASDVARLRDYHGKITAGSAVDFAELHNVLGRIKGSFV